ncbi:MmgE/PrpD family protein [Mycobacterium sp. 3519A]|uniref:MmgE/PrpD family protein n=1 Tax=Mycobacterium sp. 3519A TaxID=2057184 RepID=UPI000C798681|nr:MmgE/PrpD family protein [Mycobacterium sp. 3519A]
MASDSGSYDDRTSVETRTLLDFVCHTSAAEIPAEVLHESARCLLDHVGLAVAGAQEPAARIVREQCAVLGGEQQALALGTTERLRVTDAALANGIACHALDFDDTHVPTILHPTTPLYAAGTPLAQWRATSGVDLLAAHALGYELAARASNALYPEHYDAGWHMTGTTGALAAATVAIRLLGLTGIAATHCLSIAATQAAGHREQFGTMTKPFHAGHAAASGVWAGLLAAGGFTGAPDPLQGRRGMFAVMSSASSANDLVDRLGQRWQIFDNGVKPYACGVVIHPAIDAVRDLAVRRGLAPDAIEKIRLRVHPLVLELTGKTDPRTGLEGKFSVTFACSIALLDGRAGEAEFSDSAVVRPDVRDLMARIEVVPDADVPHTQAGATALTDDGNSVDTWVDHARGTPGNRLSDDELRDKFHGLADGVLGRERANQLAEAVFGLADGGGVDAMVELTTPLAR